MNLVDYSDSDASDSEQSKLTTTLQPVTKAPAPGLPKTNFSIDRSNPQKIRVKLDEAPKSNGTHVDEPAPKRARVGGGAFSDFNSFLPPPKRDADSKQQSLMSRGPVRKVFSLKTGAEPGFSRESDAEMKNLFAEHDSGTQGQDDDATIPDVPKKTSPPQAPVKGNAFMFKPLSVARGSNKKKKPVNVLVKSAAPFQEASVVSSTTSVEESTSVQPPKVSLFSTGRDQEPEILPIEPAEEDDIDPIPADEDDQYQTNEIPVPTANHSSEQDLDSIASDLNLSAAERRRLFGRGAKSSTSAVNISNFNMDQEYMANEELRAAGEQQQHNPLRAIAPGKHSLKQLVNAAQGQKDGSGRELCIRQEE